MNNKTFRAVNFPLESYANKAVVNATFTFILPDGSAYDFTGQTGLFLSLFDIRDGNELYRWTETNGLSLSANVVTWNEPNSANMSFSKGKYYYELGYLITDYFKDVQVCLSFGEHKFI